MRQERENEDVRLRLEKEKGEAQRKRLLDAINLIFARVTDGGREFLGDPLFKSFKRVRPLHCLEHFPCTSLAEQKHRSYPQQRVANKNHRNGPKLCC